MPEAVVRQNGQERKRRVINGESRMTIREQNTRMRKEGRQVTKGQKEELR